jgi:hypothetical protein
VGPKLGVAADGCDLILCQPVQLFLAEAAFSDKVPEDERENRVPVVVLCGRSLCGFGSDSLPVPRGPTAAHFRWLSSLESYNCALHISLGTMEKNLEVA